MGGVPAALILVEWTVLLYFVLARLLALENSQNPNRNPHQNPNQWSSRMLVLRISDQGCFLLLYLVVTVLVHIGYVSGVNAAEGSYSSKEFSQFLMGAFIAAVAYPRPSGGTRRTLLYVTL